VLKSFLTNKANLILSPKALMAAFRQQHAVSKSALATQGSA
jgi:hypothetical protein